jgi:hypothetical protein
MMCVGDMLTDIEDPFDDATFDPRTGYNPSTGDSDDDEAPGDEEYWADDEADVTD